MSTVKLYKITRTKTYMMSEQGESISLYPAGESTSEYESYDDGGKDYILPDGYELGENTDGVKMIFDRLNKGCEIVLEDDDSVSLVSLAGAVTINTAE